MWTRFFDKIYLINLPAQTQKLARASSELKKYGIPFQVITATEHENGAYGLFLTMRSLFNRALKQEGHQHILVFEDDVKFVEDPNFYLFWMIEQLVLQHNWELFYLGANTHKPLQRVSPNVLRAENCRSTHAVVYSRDGMRRALDCMDFFVDHIDVIFETLLQPKGNCYVAWPMIATQANGWSDIEKRNVDQSYIVERFKENTKHLE